MNTPIKRTGQGMEVTLWRDGWPRSCTITTERGQFSVQGTAQIRALHFMLGEVLAADDAPDDRPLMMTPPPQR